MKQQPTFCQALTQIKVTFTDVQAWLAGDYVYSLTVSGSFRDRAVEYFSICAQGARDQPHFNPDIDLDFMLLPVCLPAPLEPIKFRSPVKMPVLERSAERSIDPRLNRDRLLPNVIPFPITKTEAEIVQQTLSVDQWIAFQSFLQASFNRAKFTVPTALLWYLSSRADLWSSSWRPLTEAGTWIRSGIRNGAAWIPRFSRAAASRAVGLPPIDPWDYRFRAKSKVPQEVKAYLTTPTTLDEYRARFRSYYDSADSSRADKMKVLSWFFQSKVFEPEVCFAEACAHIYNGALVKHQICEVLLNRYGELYEQGTQWRGVRRAYGPSELQEIVDLSTLLKLQPQLLGDGRFTFIEDGRRYYDGPFWWDYPIPEPSTELEGHTIPCAFYLADERPELAKQADPAERSMTFQEDLRRYTPLSHSSP